MDPNQSTLSKEDVKAQREARRALKLASKHKCNESTSGSFGGNDQSKKLADVAASTSAPPPPLLKTIQQTKSITDENRKPSEKNAPTEAAAAKPTLTKAERRAIQEAQRLAKVSKAKTPPTVQPAKPDRKANDVAEKQPSSDISKQSAVAPVKQATKVKVALGKSGAGAGTTTKNNQVKLFNHLYTERPKNVLLANNIHPSIVKLGAQYANRIVVGSNARCIAFMNTIKLLIEEYDNPPNKKMARGVEAIIQPNVQFLHASRPLSVSITNALKFIKWQIANLDTDDSDVEQKQTLLDSIDTYIRDQLEKAAQAISISVQQKISNNDVILTFGCSSLITHILEEAKKRNVDFRVIVVDARPDHEGQEMLRRLVSQNIRCTIVMINAIGFIMPEVTKVLLGAHALMANGYVMSRAGTAQVALVAKAYNVPVLVCCETHKFSERVQTDAFVYNEIGDPDQLVLKSTLRGTNQNALFNWENQSHLTVLNLCYDITPPELVTAVVTELAILPCTSVPVILRIQPS